MNWLQHRAHDLGFALLKRSGPVGTVAWPTWAEGWALKSGDARKAAENAYAEAVWFFACVKAKFEFAAQVPFRLYRIPKGKMLKDKELLPWEHDANKLYRRPNAQATQASLREYIVASLEIAGNAFVYKATMVPKGTPKPESLPTNGEPTELWFMRPDQVETKVDDRGIILGYRYAGRDVLIPPERIIHYRTFNPASDVVGQSTIKPLTRVLATDILAQMYDEQFLKQGCRPPGVLSTEARLADPVRERLEADLKKRGGPEGAGKMLILEQGLTYQQMGLSQKDMEMPGLRAYDRESIMAATGVTGVIVCLQSANYATANAEMRIFTENKIMPLLDKIGQYDNAFLLSDFGPDIMGEHDYSVLPALAEDKEAKARVSSIYIKSGVLCPDEVRHDDLNKEPREDGEGGVYQTPSAAGGFADLFGGGAKSRSHRDPVPIAYTPAQELRLESYRKRREPLEKQVARWWVEAFEKQEQDVLAQIEAPRSKRALEEEIDDAFILASTEETVRRSLIAAIEAGLIHAKEPLDWLTIDFDLKNPKLQAWLNLHAAQDVRLIADTTESMLRDKIKEIVAQGVADGKGTAEIAKDLRSGVSEIFQTRTHNAKTIAQTEVTKGVQETQLMVWEESGVVEGKEWIASMLDNGRHNEMHGQVVPLDEDFVHPGGEFCDAGTRFRCPGGSGLADQDINCHCDDAPVVSAKAKMDYLSRQLSNALYPATGRGSREWQTRENLKALSR